MSFDKRDYLYDDGQDNDSGTDEEEIPDIQSFKDRVPREWVQHLLFTLNDMAKSKGVELLDRCTTTDLAEFTGRYAQNVWRY